MNNLSSQSSPRIPVRALLLGDHIDTAGLERPDILSTMPLAFRIEGHSFVVIFRYGVVVLFGMTPLQEDQIIQSLADASLGVIHVANRKRPRLRSHRTKTNKLHSAPQYRSKHCYRSTCLASTSMTGNRGGRAAVRYGRGRQSMRPIPRQTTAAGSGGRVILLGFIGEAQRRITPVHASLFA